MASPVSASTYPGGSAEILTALVQDLEVDPTEYRRQIRRLLDENPQSFLSAAVEVIKRQPDSRGAQFVASLLVSSGLILSAVCDPSLTHEEALAMARLAMRPDTMKEVVLGRASADRAASSRLIRILEERATGKDHLPRLRRLLRQPNPYLRSKAVLMLARDTRNVNWVRKTLADGDARIRANAVEALWGIDTPEIRELLDSLREDRSNRVAGNALLALYRLGEVRVIPEIIRMGMHQDPTFRSTAAWVMGNTTHPRFEDALSQLLKDPDSRPRRTAIASLARVRKAEMLAHRLPPRRVAAHLGKPGMDGRPRIDVALAKLPHAETSPVLPTHFVLSEDGHVVHDYAVATTARKEHSEVVFLVPCCEPGSSSAWSSYALACLKAKRAADAWACVPYASGMLQSGDPLTGETGLRFHSGETDIRDAFGSIPFLPTHTDVWHAIWRSLQPQVQDKTASRHLIICNDSPSDRLPGPELISRVADSGGLLQVVSSVENTALAKLCSQCNGTFLLGRTRPALAGLVEQAYLNLQVHYEISYQPGLAGAKTLKITFCHPSGWGETTVPIPPAGSRFS